MDVRREPFGTVANAAGERGRNAGNRFCGVFELKRTDFLASYLIFKNNIRDFGSKKRRAYSR
jgi:hypothetical protein